MEDLYLKMNGAAFNDGYRLDKMIAGLSGAQQVVEGVYKGVTGKVVYRRKIASITKSLLMKSRADVYSSLSAQYSAESNKLCHSLRPPLQIKCGSTQKRQQSTYTKSLWPHTLVKQSASSIRLKQ